MEQNGVVFTLEAAGSRVQMSRVDDRHPSPQQVAVYDFGLTGFRIREAALSGEHLIALCDDRVLRIRAPLTQQSVNEEIEGMFDD